MTRNEMINKLIDEIPLDVSNLFYEVNQVGYLSGNPYDTKFSSEFDALYIGIGSFMKYIDDYEEEVLFVREGELYSLSALHGQGTEIYLSKIQNRNEYIENSISKLDEHMKDVDKKINKLNRKKENLLISIEETKELKEEDRI